MKRKLLKGVSMGSACKLESCKRCNKVHAGCAHKPTLGMIISKHLSC